MSEADKIMEKLSSIMAKLENIEIRIEKLEQERNVKPDLPIGSAVSKNIP